VDVAVSSAHCPLPLASPSMIRCLRPAANLAS
jgi:hypothetical protein